MTKVLCKTAMLCAVFVAFAMPAFAQLSANGGAIDINSDKLEIFDSKNEVIFTGRVDATQDDARLRADKLKVLFAKAIPVGGADGEAGAQLGAGFGEIKTIIATGNVYYVTAQQIATANKAVYDVAKDQVTMRGNVVVTQGQNVIRGTSLVLKISTGMAVFGSNNGQNSSSGRVRAVFFPEENTEDASDASGERDGE